MGAHPWLGETLCETGARDSVSDPLSSLENAILWVHILGTFMDTGALVPEATVCAIPIKLRSLKDALDVFCHFLPAYTF